MIRIHNVETGEVIDREMTQDEQEVHFAQAEALALLEAQAQAKAIAKSELLERLGISAQEARLLLS